MCPKWKQSQSSVSEKDGLLGNPCTLWCDSKSLCYERRIEVSHCQFLKENIYKGKIKSKPERERGEQDFTWIPEATVRFTLFWYVLSLTSYGCHGIQSSKVGWALGINVLSHFSLAVLLLSQFQQLVYMRRTSLEKWKRMTGCLSSTKVLTWHHEPFRPTIFTGWF